MRTRAPSELGSSGTMTARSVSNNSAQRFVYSVTIALRTLTYSAATKEGGAGGNALRYSRMGRYSVHAKVPRHQEYLVGALEDGGLGVVT